MRQQSGFTLIELMFVVALIAIITGIAMPAYKNHVAKSKRAAAQSALLEIANIMERQRLQKGSYTAIDVSQFKAEGYKILDIDFYDPGNKNAFKIHAQPTGGMVGDGRLYVDHLGKRCWNNLDNDGARCDKQW